MPKITPKITLLGAGSGFTQVLFTDILHIEGIEKGVIGLVDVDKKRLDINVQVMERILKLMEKPKWSIEASTDRTKVLQGSDYVISTIEVAGLECVRHDNDIPLKYGIDQCIGDTIGPGGIMKALRTLPVFLDIMADIKALCPKALVMNYTNPMSIMCLGAARVSGQPFVGLCHSVQGSSRQLADVAGVPVEEVVFRCGGINHLAWFTEFAHMGKDLYPRILEAIEDPETYERDPVRFEMMRQFGYFVTESSGHFSEYVPYFRKRKDLIQRYCRSGYLGGSSFYANEWPGWRKKTDKDRVARAKGKMDIPLDRSHEYASSIIEAHLLGRQTTIYATVPNTGLIPNLPSKGVVEVATLVDTRGYTPTYFGPLPEQVAALCRAHFPVIDLTAQGVIEQNREAIVHAMMLDPLTAAVCSPQEVRDMAGELFAAEAKYIPKWCQEKKKPKKSVGKKRKTSKVTSGAEEVSAMAARNIKK